MNPRDTSRSNGKNPVVSPHRLSVILSKFSTLHQDGQALIGQIRGSIHELREVRNEIHRNQLKSHPNGRVGQTQHLHDEYRLTGREAQVALLLAQGKSNAAVAASLGISLHTARHHTQRVLAKLEVHSRAAAGAKIRG